MKKKEKKRNNMLQILLLSITNSYVSGEIGVQAEEKGMLTVSGLTTGTCHHKTSQVKQGQ